MRDTNELNREGTKVDDVARLDSMQQDIIQKVMLLKFAFCQTSGEVRTINWHVELLKQVRECAQMIFMTMRQYDRGDIVLVLVKKRKVWNGNVHAVGGFFRETHSGVENEHLVAITHSHTIHPKLADTAEGNDFEDVGHLLFVDSTLWTGWSEYIMSNRAATFINNA